MRTLCPNEDGLDTVLEIPMPEEMFLNPNCIKNTTTWQSMKSYWTKPTTTTTTTSSSKNNMNKSINNKSVFGGKNAQIQLLLGVVAAPLIPIPINPDDHAYEQPINKETKDQPIAESMAKYIVKQYIAAIGGDKTLTCLESMYAIGKVRMAASEVGTGEPATDINNNNSNKLLKTKNSKITNNGNNNINGEMGGFVLWQKGPELWCLELVVSGNKISAGSDGVVAWRQTPWHHSHASRGPPRPLRRFLQGLDPKSTASLFSRSICIGEKTINDEDCFILKLEADPPTLLARSNSNVEIIRHTIWGYFSQKTGLLVQLEDSHLLRMHESIFWETSMETLIQDYRPVDGVQIAHGGKTSVSLFRFGDNSDSHSRTRMEEIWEIEEIDFNIMGLSKECFLPPSDLKKEEEEEEEGACYPATNPSLPLKIRTASLRLSSSKVFAIDED